LFFKRLNLVDFGQTLHNTTQQKEKAFQHCHAGEYGHFYFSGSEEITTWGSMDERWEGTV